jgi:hypothetical protein
MNTVFHWCVDMLVFLAAQLGMTYKEINVWIFVIIWPILTLVLVALVVWQHLQIRQLRKMGIEGD